MSEITPIPAEAPAAGKPLKPFRFGVQAFNAASAAEWREQLQGLGNGFPLYRAALTERLAAIRQARATGTPVAPATPPVPVPGQSPDASAGTNGNAAGAAPEGNSSTGENR